MSENQHDPDLPFDENSEAEALWQQWKQHRRSQAASEDLADRVMNVVTESANVTRGADERLLMKISDSPWARLGICSAAMLIGLVPFLYLAMTAKLLMF